MYQALPEPSEAELDMLDLAFEVESTSRLACQVYINDNILDLPPEDLQVTIPAEVVDLWA
jgi:2Fe-2S ferredoxin